MQHRSMSNPMNREEYPAPPIDPELVKHLEKLFTLDKLKVNDSDREVGYKLGQADVVKYLKRVLEEQQDNILNMKGL